MFISQKAHSIIQVLHQVEHQAQLLMIYSIKELLQTPCCSEPNSWHVMTAWSGKVGDM